MSVGGGLLTMCTVAEVSSCMSGCKVLERDVQASILYCCDCALDRGVTG